MFWGAFSWDRKGPCHVWKPETVAERLAAQTEIDDLNAENEPHCKAEWELTTNMARLGLRTKSGRRPTWRFSERTGKLVRKKGSTGID